MPRTIPALPRPRLRRRILRRTRREDRSTALRRLTARRRGGVNPNQDTSYENPRFSLAGVSNKVASIVVVDYVYGGEIVTHDAKGRRRTFAVSHGNVPVHDETGETLRLDDLAKGDTVAVAHLESTSGSTMTATKVFKLPQDFSMSWTPVESTLDESGRIQIPKAGASLVPFGSWTVDAGRPAAPGSGRADLVLKGPRFTQPEQPILYVFSLDTQVRNLEDLADRLRHILLEDKKGLLQGETRLQVAGTPAGVMQIEGKLGTQPFRQDIVFLLRGNKALVLMFAARPEDYPAVWDQFRQMVCSMTVER